MYSLQMKTFTETRERLLQLMSGAPKTNTERWQGKDVSKDPAATSYELRNVVFEVPLQEIEALDHWREDIQPNLPWADDHFLERVGGEPLNPGVQWANWPWASSADKHRVDGQKFNHSYMQRFWPKWAHFGDDVVLDTRNRARLQPSRKNWKHPMPGLHHPYGDLQDLVDLLAKEPFTRQAYIPLFFPEDTGFGDGGRKPCTLGYQIMVRYDEEGTPCAHIWYPLRSCDFVRHWADDCYLAVRLLLWIIDECRKINPYWGTILPGTFAMHCTSLHIFENDRRQLFGSTLRT